MQGGDGRQAAGPDAIAALFVGKAGKPAMGHAVDQ